MVYWQFRFLSFFVLLPICSKSSATIIRVSCELLLVGPMTSAFPAHNAASNGALSCVCNRLSFNQCSADSDFGSQWRLSSPCSDHGRDNASALQQLLSGPDGDRHLWNGDTLNIYGPTTVITTATLTVTKLPTPSSPGFNIQIQGLNTKAKRAVSYIGFSGGPNDHGIAVGSQNLATVFQILDASLISDGEFIETALGIGFLQFQKTFTAPTDNSIWFANTTSLELTNPAFSTGNGQARFCVAPDDSVYVELNVGTAIHLCASNACRNTRYICCLVIFIFA